jgi:hypothetical protein
VSLAARVAFLVGGAVPDAIYSFSVTRMDALALGAAVVRPFGSPPWPGESSLSVDASGGHSRPPPLLAASTPL